MAWRWHSACWSRLRLRLDLYGLDRWSLWLDETVQYHYASTPLGELYEAMDAYAAPLSLELSRALVWLGLDHTGGMLRLPSAIIGVATVILVYLLAKELFCRRVAWLSALVACVMPVLIVYSQEYRPYSLLIFLTTLSSWSLAAGLRTNAPIWWCAFVGATILDVYTHFVALPALAGLIVFASGYILLEVLHKKPVKSTIMSALLAFTIIGIAYIPALPRLARLFAFEAKEMGSGGTRLGRVQACLCRVSGVWGMARRCRRRRRFTWNCLVCFSLSASRSILPRYARRFRGLIPRSRSRRYFSPLYQLRDAGFCCGHWCGARRHHLRS